MKIRIFELKSIIREILAEAPLEDIYPVISKKSDPEDEDFFGDLDDYDPKKDPKKVQKFFSSKAFSDKAFKVFRFIKTPIYLVPVERPSFTSNARSWSPDSEERQREVLRELNIPDEKIDFFIEQLSKGACVLIAEASQVAPGFQPTPWMIVHALLDDALEHVLMMSEVYDTLTPLFGRKWTKLVSALTMKSARNNEIQNEADICAEIITQAVTTTNGFVYNKTGDDEIDSALEKVSHLVANAKDDMSAWISGKLIQLDVVSLG
jgi:hypothetical protein